MCLFIPRSLSLSTKKHFSNNNNLAAIIAGLYTHIARQYHTYKHLTDHEKNMLTGCRVGCRPSCIKTKIRLHGEGK